MDRQYQSVRGSKHQANSPSLFSIITISKPELERITSNLDEYSQFIEKLSSFIEENAGAPIACLKLTHAENASTFLFNPTLSEFVLGLSNLEIPASPPVSTAP